MERNRYPLVNECSLQGIRPIMADLPYPPIQVRERNPKYAELLMVDYCGSVSELSAILQYINNENRMSGEHCSLIRTILGIAMAEMMHLQKLGELIWLLGGEVDFVARYRGNRKCIWTAQYAAIPCSAREMLLTDIEGEKQAIAQYRAHINAMEDAYVNAVLKRIIKDEEYHIMLLENFLEEL